MKNLLCLLVLIITISACDNTNGPTLERRYYENVELSLPIENSGTSVNWDAGEKTVIVFSFFHEEEEEISDDELAELLYIELPADATEFSISTGGDVLHPDIELYYVRSCFCYFEAPYTFLRKDVSGLKISDNKWRITFDIIAEAGGFEYELSDSGVYVLSTLEN